MNTKVGKDYILPGETRKRKTSEVVWLTIWIILSVTWISFILTLSFKENFWSTMSFSKSTFGALFLCNIPTFFLLSTVLIMMKDRLFVRTVELLIHQYERWNFKESKYETFYVTEHVSLSKNFFYFKYTGDTVDKKSKEEITEFCNNKTNKNPGFKTKDEAMRHILDTIKELIAEDKAQGSIKVRNVNTLETFTIEALKFKFENKEFDHLYKDEQEEK